MPRGFASWMGLSRFLRSRVTRPRLPTVRHTRRLRTMAQGHMVRPQQVPVPRYVDADVRLWQTEVRAAGLTGLYLLEVERLDIGFPGRRGMLWQEHQVLFEVGPPFGVIPDSVAVALEPHAARI